MPVLVAAGAVFGDGGEFFMMVYPCFF